MKGLSLVIVGGGAGLGALLVEMAVAEGAAAIGVIDIDGAAAEAALAPARKAGLLCAHAACDIRTAPTAHAAFAEVAAKLGRVDTLVNSAAIRQMRRQPLIGPVRGRIVNITSVDAFKAHPQNAHYAATKAAVVSLTRSMAQEVAPDGILVNSVAPAGMATEKARASGFLQELAKASPLGRGGEPREMAEWVLMAGGPRNTYMTGENIIVSGGYIYA